MRYILLFCLIITTTLLKAQYIPLHLDVGTCWSSIRYVGCPHSGVTTVFKYTTVLKDTFINGLHYYKTLKRSVVTGTANPNPYPTISDYYLILRNDTVNRKVFYYDNGIDKLLYDFNLTLGSIVPSTSWVVDTVGTTLCFGVNRKFYGVKNFLGDLLFYEGIGENRDVFTLSLSYYDPDGCLIDVYPLNCGYKGSPLYGDSTRASSCYPLGIDDVKIEKFSIYPNPTNDYLNINFEKDNISHSIKILNIEGKIVYQKSTMNNMQIDCSNWHRGIYILSISDGVNNYNKKIVII